MNKPLKKVSKKVTDKLNPKRVGLTLGLVFVIISLVCAILIAISPGLVFNLASGIFHSIDLSQIAIPMTLSSVIVGVIELFVIGFVGGWLFAVVYNKFK